VTNATPAEFIVDLTPSGAITARHFASAAVASPLLVLAHGAGADQRHRWMVDMARRVSARGVDVVTFNFLYTEQHRRTPDRAPVLEQTWRAVLDGVVRHLEPRGRVAVGGKSMGGRIASQAVAQGAPAEGLVFLGYPLHAPGKTEVRRDRHLPAIAAPMLFVQGTRDAFARWDLLESLVERLGPRATLHRIEEGDHSFKVPKRTGLGPAEVQADVFAAILRWLEAHGL
jgi:predicted alpha/beta-hydrolase family hydrolase